MPRKKNPKRKEAVPLEDPRHLHCSAPHSASLRGQLRSAVQVSGAEGTGATIFEPRIIQDRNLEAEYSFAFLVDVRNNPSEPLARRIECAEMILDRVQGKPSQGVTDDVPPSAKAMIEKYYEAIGEGRRKTNDR